MGSKYITKGEEPQTFPVIGETITCFDLFQNSMEGDRLILKDIKDISDDDITEIAKLASYHPDVKEDWENIICDFDVDEIVRHDDRIEVKHTCICYEGSFTLCHDGQMYFNGIDENGTEADPHIFIPNIIAIADYLREKSYALPYKNQSLFDLGIAVNQNQI